MASYTVISCEKTGEKPSKFGQMQILKLRLRNGEGIEKDCEWFTSVKTNVPAEGTTIEGDVTQGQYGLKFSKPKGSGGGKSPESERRMNRASAQKQACQIVLALGRVPSEQEMVNLINWFEDDIYGKLKSGTNAWPMNSDVPGDLSDTPFEGS